jgi:hypothetical protein
MGIKEGEGGGQWSENVRNGERWYWKPRFTTDCGAGGGEQQEEEQNNNNNNNNYFEILSVRIVFQHIACAEIRLVVAERFLGTEGASQICVQPAGG